MKRDLPWFSPIPGALHRGLFRSVDLNALGWLAVLGPGACLGLALTLATGGPAWAFIPLGCSGSWFAALALDHRAWQRTPIGISAGDLSHQQCGAIAAKLRAAGVEVVVDELRDPFTGEIDYTFRSYPRFADQIWSEINQE